MLSSQLKAYVTHDDETSDVRYNQLYAVYSYPNIILPLVGGVLIDKIGLNFSIILFDSLQLLGQGIFTIAGYMGTENKDNNWPFIIAITGRLFLGLGGESLTVCQSTVLSRWFMGKELASANGFVISINCLVGVAATYSMPPLAEETSLAAALTVGFVFCVISFV